MTPPPEADPAEWPGRARTDLRVAEFASTDPDLPAWPAGFHLQQAAEKALEAVLIAHGCSAPRTHDLEPLVEAVAPLEPSLAEWADPLLSLGDFSVAQRYPGVAEASIDLAAMSASVRELVMAAERICALLR